MCPTTSDSFKTAGRGLPAVQRYALVIDPDGCAVSLISSSVSGPASA